MTLEEQIDLQEYQDRIVSMAERAEELRALGVHPEGLREMYHWHFQELERESIVYKVDRQVFFDLYLGTLLNWKG